MRAKVRIQAMILTIGIAFALVACSNSGTSSDLFVSWELINQEYQETVASFPYPLPAGVEFPADMDSGPEDNMVFERGFGEMQAYMFAVCAYHAIVVANEDANPEVALAALDKAEEIRGADGYQSHYSDPDGAWEDVITKARLGDYSVFNQFYQTDCGG